MMPRDLTHAIRSLRRAPGFSLVAIGTLALAIGSTTAVFSVVDAIVLRGLPYGHAGDLRTVYERSEDGNLRLPSFPTFTDWRAQSASVRDVIDDFAFVRGDGVIIGDKPDRQIAAFVTPGFFGLMQARPLIGRTFLPEEERPGGPRVAVLSFDFFMNRYGGDRSIVGKTIPIDSMPTTVVGVMPSGFAFPNFGSGGWLPPAAWQPVAIYQATHNTLTLRGLHVDSRAILRLRPGVDSARAAAAMHTIQQRLAMEYPKEQAHWTQIAIRSLPDELFGQLWSTLALVAGAIGLVLLLACANVANLMLIRASVRTTELAVRAALGAGRLRLARQPLVEAAVIAVAGGAIGAAFAAILVHLARPFADQRLPFATHIAIDPRTIGFGFAVTAFTTLLVGGLPALHAGRGNLVDRLRGGAASRGGAADLRVRNALVSLQFALAITLLIGAGLLVQSVRRVTSVPLGYDPNGVITFAIRPPAKRYDAPADAAALYRRIMEAVRSVPSVQNVAAAGGALIPTKVDVDGRARSSSATLAVYHPISSEYLATMRVPMVAGRAFSEDDMRAPTGLLVSDTLAKQLWPGGKALGQRITIYRQSQARTDFGQPITLPIVGVVADYREFGPEADAPAEVYLPYTLEVWPWMSFVVRGGTSASVLTSIKDAVKRVEPAVTFFGEPSFDRSGQRPAFSDPRMFVTALLGAFGATALLLAAIGLYGVVAYAVTQRTREIGIRIAIGATSSHIVRLLLRQASTFVVIGIVAGVLAAAGATKVLQSLLFQTTTTDVTTFLLVPVVLGLVALAASCVPAFRATRTDPSIVIRAE